MSANQPKPVYTVVDFDVVGLDLDRDLGFPGEYPFTRGIQPTMYRGRLWTMRQYAGMGDAEESNRRYKFLLANGTAGLSVAFDLPTQIGYDSDDPMALGEVGKVGVAIDSIEDMERLFDGIPLDKISTSMTINATASILLALYVAVARRTGADVKKLSGTVQNDILKEYIARGTYIYPIRHAMRIVTDMFAWANEEVPEWNPISISGYHMREAGSTAAQELAFTLGNGIAYVQAAVDAGLDIDRFAPSLSFFFNAHNNFFEEVAKFRCRPSPLGRASCAIASQQRIPGHGCCASTPRPPALLSPRSSRKTTSSAPPSRPCAAVLGGTQSLHTNGYDEALALPTEEAARIALRTQQIIASESGVAQTIDPFAGSYYVESLTTEIEQQARTYLNRISALGGMLRAIERGWVQQEIQNAAYDYQRAVDTAEAVVVGVNRFTREEEPDIPIQRIDESLERRQVERLRALRARRDAQRWQSSLNLVRDHARSGASLMPAILEAVESYATVGEIAASMRDCFGEYQESVVI